MNGKWLYICVPAILLAMGWGSTVADEDTASAGKSGEEEEKEKKDAAPEFPSALRLDPEKMPEPVRKSVLQRIDEHERLEELLRNQPLEIQREEGTGD
ncbi:hypothetical protein DES49_1590 [Halospina denitrificans]|uniref:Uncharacterized protein n=1 Tax=Halospina denitrificans TaxID=332522 RepID=A0A4R7JTX3_9GAMM|nr:hypothetical protein [Halospina denitrificans]TDT41495.1 hypothetical protein DES49_1590 [Halospina denitrificans]